MDNGTSLVDILNLDTLLAQLILAFGAALVLGNGWAIVQERRGRKPKGEEGDFRPARAWWLAGVGIVMSVWGLASLFG